MTSRMSVLVLGGSSDIGRAAARAFAKAGYDVSLAGRDAGALEPDAADLRARYNIEASTWTFEVLDTASFDGFVAGLPVLPDVVISIVASPPARRALQASDGLHGDQISYRL